MGTWILDGTSLVSSGDAASAAAAAAGWVKTMVATILSLTVLLVTFFFGNRIIWLLKWVLQG